MKILKAKKSERLYYTLSFNLKNNTYQKNLFLLKHAIVSLFGMIPIYTTKTIYIDIVEN